MKSGIKVVEAGGLDNYKLKYIFIIKVKFNMFY